MFQGFYLTCIEMETGAESASMFCMFQGLHLTCMAMETVAESVLMFLYVSCVVLDLCCDGDCC